jgi:hypothetical protein
MFVRCPDKDWYTDGTYDARARAAAGARGRPLRADDVVTCWYGSMGGHGALKFALAFGWRAIVFNPQTDLDLWAAFRPRERHLLWGARAPRRLAELPARRLGAHAAVPGLRQRHRRPRGAVGGDRAAAPLPARQRHHREVRRRQPCRADGAHQRRAGGAHVLARIDQRLQLLRADTLLPGMQAVPADGAAAWWDRLDAARVLKLELQLREGRLWWQPSDACGTRP